LSTSEAVLSVEYHPSIRQPSRGLSACSMWKPCMYLLLSIGNLMMPLILKI